MKLTTELKLAIAMAAVIVGLGVFLFVQDQRHGWPFSAHHAMKSSMTTASSETARDAPPAIRRSSVEIGAAQIDTLGISFEPVRSELLSTPMRAVATVVADESRISHVHTRISGWIEQLHVSTTGDRVKAGQPLAAVFSQELYSSQNEFLSALRQAQSGPASAIVEAAQTRLKVLGMSDAEIQDIQRSGQARRLITITAPRGGVILKRGISVGTAVDPSTELFTIADLSRVWVIAELAEGHAEHLAVGASAKLEFPASGRAPLVAAVDFIYQTLTERTRTVRVRLTADNKDGRLRPGLYGTAEFAAAPRRVLTVARDAVVNTGSAQHIFVRTAGGIEPRNVQIGGRIGERIEVFEGVSEGDQVVTAGVFLIDSESRLRASGSGGHIGHGAADSKLKPAETGDQSSSEHSAQRAQH